MILLVSWGAGCSEAWAAADAEAAVLRAGEEEAAAAAEGLAEPFCCFLLSRKAFRASLSKALLALRDWNGAATEEGVDMPVEEALDTRCSLQWSPWGCWSLRSTAATAFLKSLREGEEAEEAEEAEEEEEEEEAEEDAAAGAEEAAAGAEEAAAAEAEEAAAEAAGGGLASSPLT